MSSFGRQIGSYPIIALSYTIPVAGKARAGIARCKALSAPPFGGVALKAERLPPDHRMALSVATAAGQGANLPGTDIYRTRPRPLEGGG